MPANSTVSETRDLEKHRPERGRHQVEDSKNEGGKLLSKDQEVTVFILQSTWQRASTLQS